MILLKNPATHVMCELICFYRSARSTQFFTITYRFTCRAGASGYRRKKMKTMKKYCRLCCQLVIPYYALRDENRKKEKEGEMKVSSFLARICKKIENERAKLETRPFSRESALPSSLLSLAMTDAHKFLACMRRNCHQDGGCPPFRRSICILI